MQTHRSGRRGLRLEERRQPDYAERAGEAEARKTPGASEPRDAHSPSLPT
jgi:hypothetical protein